MSASPQYDAEVFSADAQVVPSTANAQDGTIDVVWYSGAAVPRIDRATGEPYMLQLDMQGCRFDRLNNGAPVFDTHFTGDDFKSLIAGKVGTRAQVGVVRRAWPNGEKGMATLQFDLGDEDGAEMFRKASTGILQNLSFGTFIYQREQVEAQTEGTPEGKPPYLNNKEVGMFKATDWEPFEISPCTVPADFNTCFLSAQPTGEVAIGGTPESAGAADALRATSPHKEKPAMPETTTQETGADARVVNEQALAAAREEAVQAERLRVSEIQSLGATATKYGIDGAVISEFIAKGVSVDLARKELFDRLEQGAAGLPTASDSCPCGESSMTRDAGETRLACMQMALLLRADARFFLARRRDHNGNDLGEYLDGCGPDQQKRAAEMAREYRNFKLIDMAKEALSSRHQPARHGRDAHRGTGAARPVAGTGVLRRRRRIHRGLSGDPGQRRQQDPAPGLRSLSAHLPAVLPAGDGAGLQAHQPRDAGRCARLAGAEREGRVPPRAT